MLVLALRRTSLEPEVLQSGFGQQVLNVGA